MRTPLPITLAALVALALAGCATDEDPAAAQPAAATEAAPTSTPPPITPPAGSRSAECPSSAPTHEIRLTAQGVSVPDAVPGPVVDLSIVNADTALHELALSRVADGTTVADVRAAAESDADPSWLLEDVGGISWLGPGETVRYQRALTPGRYALLDPFPVAEGSGRERFAATALFTVTDAGRTTPPTSDVTVHLRDGRIDTPSLPAGTHRIAVTNSGTVPHEVYLGGAPRGTLDAASEKLGAWLEDGQDGPNPVPGAHFPFGQQSIRPGQSVVVTITIRSGYSYRFFALDDPEAPEVSATVDVP